MKKTKKILLWSLLICLLLGGAGYGGWIWYDNHVDRSGWRQKDGVTMYADFHGKPVTGWQDIDGARYYFDADCALYTGWFTDNTGKYYLSEDGRMQTNWLQLEGNTYYFGSDGTLDTGWLTIDDSRYYFDQDGPMQTGWLQLEESLHYLNTDGTLASGWLDTEEGRFHLDENGTPLTDWQEIDGERYHFSPEGLMQTGWITIGTGTYYLDEDGVMVTGWQDVDGKNHHFNGDGTLSSGWMRIENQNLFFTSEGTLHTGWLYEGEYRYYFHEDGTMAVGPTEINGRTEYFSPKGIWVLLVNPWNPLPDDYQADLVNLKDGHRVASICVDALSRMLADAEAAGHYPGFSSTYRTEADQQRIWEDYVENYMAQGHDRDKANAMTASYVAVPGTSEHHTGLAIDIVGYDYLYGTHPGSTMAVQEWLAEHCWEYGFILRYQADKTAITGFSPETWHFRYVGTEVSMDMKDSGLCLEEYLGAVQN